MKRILLAIALSMAVPATAQAAEGTTRVDLGGAAYRALGAKGVKVIAKRPAGSCAASCGCPCARASSARSACSTTAARCACARAAARSGSTRLQGRLGRSTTLAATVRGRRITVFKATGVPALNAATGSARLERGRLSLTRAGAQAIRRGLKLKRLRSGRFGRVTVFALVDATSSQPGGGSGGGGGGGGSGPPQSGPISDEPPRLARPATAVNVAAASVTWHVRDSWTRYVSTEQDVVPLGGALPGAAIPQDQHACPDAPAGAAPGPLVYSYTVPFASGWHDAASGTAAVYTTGGAGFRFPSHGIDLDVLDLEVELTGAASRLIARFDGRGETNPGNKRGVLVDLAGAAPAPGGPAALLKGSIPDGGSESVFAGFYTAGQGFGCVSVSYSL